MYLKKLKKGSSYEDKKIGKGNIYFEVIEKDFDEEDKILTPIRIVLSKKKGLY